MRGLLAYCVYLSYYNQQARTIERCNDATKSANKAVPIRTLSLNARSASICRDRKNRQVTARRIFGSKVNDHSRG